MPHPCMMQLMSDLAKKDRGGVAPIASISPGVVTVQGIIGYVHAKQTSKANLVITEAILSDGSGTTKLIWFNKYPLTRHIIKGQEYRISGKFGFNTNDPILRVSSFELINANPNTLLYKEEFKREHPASSKTPFDHRQKTRLNRRKNWRPWAIVGAVVLGIMLVIGLHLGATAKCNDGFFSYSQHHSGTCSWHGGVEEWLGSN